MYHASIHQYFFDYVRNHMRIQKVLLFYNLSHLKRSWIILINLHKLSLLLPDSLNNSSIFNVDGFTLSEVYRNSTWKTPYMGKPRPVIAYRGGHMISQNESKVQTIFKIMP